MMIKNKEIFPNKKVLGYNINKVKYFDWGKRVKTFESVYLEYKQFFSNLSIIGILEF